MARGNARAPSANAYRGALGQTRSAVAHVTNARGDLIAVTVYRSIDAVADPELVEKLFAGTLNTARAEGGESLEANVPVVYHDPAAEVLVLVLADAHRCRELDERIHLLERLRDDDAPVPAYAKEFGVVFGAAGLGAYLEGKANQVLAARDSAKDVERAKDFERRKTELVAREAEIERERKKLQALLDEHERSKSDLARSKAEVSRSMAKLEAAEAEQHRAHEELERSRAELERMRAEARARVIAAVQTPAEPATVVAPSPYTERERERQREDSVMTSPVGRQEIDDIETSTLAALPPPPEPPAPPPALPPAPAARSSKATPANGVRAASAPAAAAIFEDESEPAGEGGKHLDGVEVDEEPTGSSNIPAGSDPLTTETQDLPVEQDRFVEAAAKSGTSSFALEGGHVRLALVAGEQIARGLAGTLDVRVLLHRLPSSPVVAVVVGPPAAMRAPKPTQLVVVPLDIGTDPDRAVLAALGKDFDVTVDVVVRGKPIRRLRMTAPLAENVAYIVRAADDHLRGITADGEAEPSFARARDLVLGAGFDLLGVEHPETGEFRDDKLAQLSTAQQVRRALAIARRFVRPSREDYLVCSRSYPLSRWRELRRLVLECAVGWGIWMGPELAQIAVSEGLARSRRDLVMKLDAGFETLRRNPDAFDIDDDAADDNAKAIAEEARALGVELRGRKSNGAIKSEDLAVVSGSIGGTPPGGISRSRNTDDLIALLDDKAQRVSAATELCDRGDPRAAAAVVAAVKKMSRAEAVRILGKSVKFGAAAAQPLIESLGSSKAFMRHGSALALALLRTEEGTHAVIDALISEPTEIWREIARAIGQIGPTALMPLAAHVGRLGDRATPQIHERVAWAMAHVGVRGGKAALDQMAAGQSVMAPIAKQALSLHSNAARDEVRVRPGPDAPKDVTVNRAFSRRFFEALEADRPEVAQAALHDIDASGPLELDESDLVFEEEDEESELDESDLIQT